MRRFINIGLGLIMLGLVAGCTAGVGPHGGAVRVGCSDQVSVHHFG